MNVWQVAPSCAAHTNAQHIAMVTTEVYLYDPDKKLALDSSQTKHIAFELQTAMKVQITDSMRRSKAVTYYCIYCIKHDRRATLPKQPSATIL